MAEIILPGTYITVRDEGLITAGQVATGNIGIVGTAANGPFNEIVTLGSYSEAVEIFGKYDDWVDGTKNELTLVRALEQIYFNGGNAVYAVAIPQKINDKAPTSTDYQAGLDLLENEIINIVLLAGQDVTDAGMETALMGHINTTAGRKRERIGLIGCSNTNSADTIVSQMPTDSDRLIFVGPGITTTDKKVMTGAYTAAAVAGLLSGIQVQTSPTNKVLNVPGLVKAFNTPNLEKLVQAKVLAVEKRDGFRIVKGITTSTNSAWHQVTTRRIVDYAVYGVRSACNPYIGKLNNDRVRGAMKATLDAFLTRMVNDEALIGYKLSVTATRPQEIAGEVAVTMTLQPTFSIDFIKVTMYLG